MRRRELRTQLIRNSILLVLLPLVFFAAYGGWQVYHYSPDAYQDLLFVLSGALLAASILAVLLSVNLAEKFTSPIETITSAARRIAAGRLSERVHVRAGNEMDILALTLNHLASRLEDKVREISGERQKLRLILEHMDNAVLLFDECCDLLESNRQAQIWFRLPVPIQGQHVLSLPGGSQIEGAIREALRTGQVQRQTVRSSVQDLTKVFHASLIPLPGEDGRTNQVLSVFHDITNLQLLKERQADFVANASHELLTPLTAIRGFAETLADGAAADPADCRHFSLIILEEAGRMQRLVKDLLQLARIETPEFSRQIDLVPVEIRTAVDAAVRELTPVLGPKQLSLTVDIPEVTLQVRTEPDLLKQILLNLLDNAVKYTPAGGSIRIAAEKKADQVLFTVQDTGIGIPEEDLPRIFERFYRIDKARSRKTAGTGLGLAIVRDLVEALGGVIEAESRLHRGTTFRFLLPSVETAAISCAAVRQSPDR